MAMNWLEKEGYLEKEFVFENFKQAIYFVNKVAALAQAANHHPDILLHQYKLVKITLSTHSQNQITEKDRLLALEIDKII